MGVTFNLKFVKFKIRFQKYDHIEIMSTTSILGHDGCHFSYEGYNEFAKRILPLVSRDLFGEKKYQLLPLHS